MCHKMTPVLIQNQLNIYDITIVSKCMCKIVKISIWAMSFVLYLKPPNQIRKAL